MQWQESRGYERVYFFNVTPHPTEPNRVWGGTWGNDIGVSQDGGATVMGLGNGLETLSVLDIWWHATAGQITVATIEGLYRSDDDGEQWFRLPGPLTEQTIYALRQDDTGRLWAGAADGLWYSDDYGVRWTPVQALAGVTITAMGSLRNAEGEERLWAGTEGAGWWLYRSDNGGSWQLAGLPGRTVYQVQMLAAQPKLQASDLIAATDQGLFRTQLTSLE